MTLAPGLLALGDGKLGLFGGLSFSVQEDLHCLISKSPGSFIDLKGQMPKTQGISQSEPANQERLLSANIRPKQEWDQVRTGEGKLLTGFELVSMLLKA